VRKTITRRRGDTTVDAELREGSRQDALRCAVAIASAQRGIGEADALARIKQYGADRVPRDLRARRPGALAFYADPPRRGTPWPGATLRWVGSGPSA
jgi:hypothetical protein